jgi:hypothetical protein
MKKLLSSFVVQWLLISIIILGVGITAMVMGDYIAAFLSYIAFAFLLFTGLIELTN